MSGTLQNLALLTLFTTAAALLSDGVEERYQIGNTTTNIDTTSSSRVGGCNLEVWNNEIYYTSPNFGTAKYPNNADCGLSGGGGPSLARFVFQPFRLQNKVNGKCVDYFNFTLPYGKGITICGKKTGKKIKFPSYNYRARFISDSSITKKGFNITIDFLPSECHKWHRLNNIGDFIEYETPYYPNKDKKKNRMCEFIVYANNGSHVQVEFLGFDLKPPCKRNNVVINMENEWNYPKETSTRHCGNSLPPIMVSTLDEAHVVYQAKDKNKGFKVRFTAV